MQCYTELTPPTAVSHSIALPFLGPKAVNLVTAKNSVLQIFELKALSTEVDGTAHDDDTSPQDLTTDAFDRTFTNDVSLQRMEQTSKFVLIADYTLAGTVTSLKRVKLMSSKSGGEALLVAFRDAKFSLVEWDPEEYCMSTISIHYYEGDQLMQSPFAPDLRICHNFLTVDPNSRCAAFKFGYRHLAILPFRQASDDLGGDDYDPDIDGDRPMLEAKATNETLESGETPYSGSFVLPLTALDPTLTHPVYLAFLYEYREPTFGVLSSSTAPNSALLPIRRDNLSYTVVTLDIEQRASTTILTISDLPYDLFEVVPLPLPVGGALLVGGNELIHIDQAGKSTAIAVNEFTRQASSYPMSDHSALALRLEDCRIVQLGDQGEMLIVLKMGQLAILSFRLDGRSVSQMDIHVVPAERGGQVLTTGASCVSPLKGGRLFIGSEESDSVILGWTRSKTSQLLRKRSQAEALAEDGDLSFDEDDIDDDDDDDIYGETSAPDKQSRTSVAEPVNPENYSFRIHDSLPNYAPVGRLTFAGAGTPEHKSNGSELPKSELVYPIGRGSAGALAIFNRELDPIVAQTIEMTDVQRFWSMHAKKSLPRGLQLGGPQDSESQLSAEAELDTFVIASKTPAEGPEESAAYSITAKGLEPLKKGDFEPEAGATVEVGTLGGNTRIVQVLKNEIRCFNSEFDLEQILPLSDEEEDEESSKVEVVSASFCDPYLILFMANSSVQLFKINTLGEVDEETLSGELDTTSWLVGCLYKSAMTDDHVFAFMLGEDGSFRIFEFPNVDKSVFKTDGLGLLPQILTAGYVPRRGISKEQITDITVADLGDGVHKQPYLIAQVESDDLVIYEPFNYPADLRTLSFSENLRWRKIPQPVLAAPMEETEREQPRKVSSLRRLNNVGGYSTVFQLGSSPSFIFKEASSLPRVIRLRGQTVKSVASFHTAKTDRGFAFLDSEDKLHASHLQPTSRFGDTGWVVRRVELGQEVQAVCYYPLKDIYIMATNEKVQYKLPEDDYHHEWQKEGRISGLVSLSPLMPSDTKFLPTIDQHTLRVFYAGNWTEIETITLNPSEVVLTIKVLNLEVSEMTRQRKPLVAVGTAIVKGEDLSTMGNIYIYDVITVVPEPGRPETDRKLKLIVKDEVKGAVSAISPIGSEGFLMMAQGQKCHVRGLKEDRTLLPVAFMDMQCYVTVAKNLPGTGMVLLGDVAKGVWFAGYTEDPYKMLMLGKGRSKMEVVDAEFLPHDKHLYFLVADADCDLHVLEFDPDNPKSMQGTRLIHKSTFHTGHFPISLTLLPCTVPAPVSRPATEPDADAMDIDAPAPTGHLVLQLSQTGSLALLTPLSESSYRRLGSLQTYLTNVLPHACGLNPRSFRAVESERFGSRSVVDGVLLSRWAELSRQRRGEAV
ncbi:protein CFT1, partial [Trichodelitschia bisporula]